MRELMTLDKRRYGHRSTSERMGVVMKAEMGVSNIETHQGAGGIRLARGRTRPATATRLESALSRKRTSKHLSRQERRPDHGPVEQTRHLWRILALRGCNAVADVSC